MLIHNKWVTGNPSNREVNVLKASENNPFTVDNWGVAAFFVPLLSSPAFYYDYIAFELWLLLSGIFVAGCLTRIVVFLKKERAAHKVYDQFARAGRIHSTGEGSPFYSLKQAVNGDVALLERSPEKVDDFLMDVAVQEAHKSLVKNPGLSEELKTKLKKTITTQADACVKVIRMLDSTTTEIEMYADHYLENPTVYPELPKQ